MKSISHSLKEFTELPDNIIPNGRMLIGYYVYVSNWAVVYCRYEVLLGMTWNKKMKPEVDNKIPRMVVARRQLPNSLQKGNIEEKIQVMNLEVREFRSLQRKKEEEVT